MPAGGLLVGSVFLPSPGLLWALPLTLPPLLLAGCTAPQIPGTLFLRRCDLSYGVYLYGWPVQQILVQFAGITSPIVLLAASLPLVLGLAVVSYFAVERLAM